MARARTWNLRINLDEFNAAFATLCDERDRSDFLAGLSRGMNGGSEREGASPSFADGLRLGHVMRGEAEEFRAGKQAVGMLGGRPRVNQSETTGEPEVNLMVTTSEPQVNQSETQSTILKEKESTPPTPLPGETPARKPRQKKHQTDDCAPEVLPLVQEVYRSIPKEHPVTGEEVHKGGFAQGARAFQRCIDEEGLNPQELAMAGRIYYAAEILEAKHPIALQGLVRGVNGIWDTRPKAMMHMSTFYGPEKRAYRQLLKAAQNAIARLAAAEPEGVAS